MQRENLTDQLKASSGKIWDVIVIGGGATGLGVAVDAVTRGYSTLLLEQADFSQSTSSRSTKLIHGGVRYLAQGDIFLVMEALRERSRMYRNARHISFDQEFIIPIYTRWDAFLYTVGLKFYDLLAGRLSMGKSRFISRDETIRKLPTVKKEGLRGGVLYHDGQFDDARFALTLAQTCHEKGGLPLNYFRVTSLLKDEGGSVTGVEAADLISGEKHTLQARVVVNATGVFVDDILKMDDPQGRDTVRPSQGVHIVLPRRFLEGDAAIMIPKTPDGRVLFAIPWYDHVIVGTTDTPVNHVEMEPQATEEEIDFILETAGRFMVTPPQRKDVLSVFAGLRPLAAPKGDETATKEVSRRHKIIVSPSGLISVIGGKWTIYRRMAQDTLDKAIKKGLLEKRPCVTKTMSLYAAQDPDRGDRLHIYGKNAEEIKKMIKETLALGKPIHPALPYTPAEILWICHHEMPVHLDDVLARRTRALFLNARASVEMAPEVAKIMAGVMGYDDDWKEEQVKEYQKLVKYYMPHEKDQTL